MNKPLVSICLPTYNYAHYLPEAISSCLNQTYESLEIIIVDDASSDNSREVINSFRDPRIRFSQNRVRLGLAGNWNQTLSLLRGRIVKFIFADDYLAENALEEIVAAYDDPRVDLVFSSARVIDGEGKYLYTHEPYSQSGLLPGPAEAKECLLKGNYIGGPSSVALRASTLERVGAFNETLTYHVDQEMWIRVMLKGDAYFLSAPLVAVRQHDGSETRRLERAKEIDSDTLRFLTCCLQNDEIRALLSGSELAELNGRSKSLLLNGVTNNERERGTLKSKIAPMVRKAIYPLYKKLVGSKNAPKST